MFTGTQITPRTRSLGVSVSMASPLATIPKPLLKSISRVLILRPPLIKESPKRGSPGTGREVICHQRHLAKMLKLGVSTRKSLNSEEWSRQRHEMQTGRRWKPQPRARKSAIFDQKNGPGNPASLLGVVKLPNLAHQVERKSSLKTTQALTLVPRLFLPAAVSIEVDVVGSEQSGNVLSNCLGVIQTSTSRRS